MYNHKLLFKLLLSGLFFSGCGPNAHVVKKQAENKEMIENAPIEAMRSIIINAPVQKIWKILIDVDDWQNWYHFLSGSRISGKFEAGSKIEYGGFFKHRLTIGVVEPPKTVVLYGTYMGFQGITVWQMDKLSENQTRVIFKESSDGGLLSILYSNAQLEKHLIKWLAKLKDKAEN